MVLSNGLELAQNFYAETPGCKKRNQRMNLKIKELFFLRMIVVLTIFVLIFLLCLQPYQNQPKLLKFPVLYWSEQRSA